MKKLIRAVLGLLALVLVGYLIWINYPKANVKSRTAMERMSASDLYQAFSSDEATAEQTYIGKVVEVRGNIDDTYLDENDAPVVLLSGENGDIVAMITLEKSEKEKVEGYRAGDEINIKAMCSGMLQEVVLTKGIIVK